MTTSCAVVVLVYSLMVVEWVVLGLTRVLMTITLGKEGFDTFFLMLWFVLLLIVTPSLPVAAFLPGTDVTDC